MTLCETHKLVVPELAQLQVLTATSSIMGHTTGGTAAMCKQATSYISNTTVVIPAACQASDLEPAP